MYLNEVPKTAAAPSWIDNLTGALPGLMQIQQMRQVQKINASRLSQGLAPIDPGTMGAQVKVGMDGKQLNKILLASGAAVLAVLAVYLISRRRK